MSNEIVKIVIASHKRADRMATHNAVANCSVCIPESQHKEYRRNYPDLEYILHPDSIIGLSAKLNWILDKYENVCILDDDIGYFYGVHETPKKPNKIDPETMYHIIQNTASITRDMGAYLFSFTKNNNPVQYVSQRPFHFNGAGFDGGIRGFLKGHDIRFSSDNIAVQDFYAYLINAYKHRFCFIDTRYASTETVVWDQPGGMREFRTMDSEKQDTLMLKRLFGDSILIKGGKKKTKHEYERTLNIRL